MERLKRMDTAAPEDGRTPDLATWFISHAAPGSPGGAHANSPAFQRRALTCNFMSPDEGTADKEQGGLQKNEKKGAADATFTFPRADNEPP